MNLEEFLEDVNTLESFNEDSQDDDEEYYAWIRYYGTDLTACTNMCAAVPVLTSHYMPIVKEAIANYQELVR